MGLARRALCALFLGIFCVACLHGIANYWQWGHDGYNGAAFHQAARNSLRFGVLGLAQYHMDLTPPTPEALYTHHPMALHLHMILAQALFGAKEWAGRVVPAILSMADLLMLCVLVARFRDRWTATIAAGLYALTPLPLIFATMVGHEQGAIFWLLAFLYGYLSYVEDPSRVAFVGSLSAVTVAMQFDWPAYYVAFFAAVHSIGRILEDRDRFGRLWGPNARFLVGLSAATLANFGGFFAWIVHERGSLEDMATAYRDRATEQSDYVAGQLDRLWDLQGPLLVALLLVWALMAARRFREDRPETIDVVVAAFLFAQAIHWVAFPSAAAHHSYWTIYLAPAIAIGGAMVIVDVFRRAQERSASAAAVVLIGLALCAQGVFAFQKLRWATQNGHATYHDDYDDQFEEIIWAREVARAFPRPTAAFAIDTSVRRRRIEFDWYLDSPIFGDYREPTRAALYPSVEHHVVLLDAAHFDWDSDYGAAVYPLLRSHRVLIWNRRFVAIDLSSTGPERSAFRSVEEPSTWLHLWLVNPDRPAVHWVADGDPDAALAALGASS